MKHMSGPWSYWGDCCRVGGKVTHVLTGIHIAAPLTILTPELTTANARLIAAAPELLEALTWYVENDISHAGDEYHLTGRNAAIAAIAKTE